MAHPTPCSGSGATRPLAATLNGTPTSPPTANQVTVAAAAGFAFAVSLEPGEHWHCCVDLIPDIDGRQMLPEYRCRSFFAPDHALERKTARFLGEATRHAGQSALLLIAAENVTGDVAETREGAQRWQGWLEQAGQWDQPPWFQSR